MPVQDLRVLPDNELAQYVVALQYRVATCELLLESVTSRLKRTVKIVRSVFLMAGGLAASVESDFLGFVLVGFGVWDCAEAVGEDAEAENRTRRLEGEAAELEAEMSLAEIEVTRRRSLV